MQGRPGQNIETPLPGFEATFSGSEAGSQAPVHLGGANSRDLANVLESHVSVSGSGYTSAESSTTQTRSKKPKSHNVEIKKPPARDRRMPEYLHEVYTHNVEDTQIQQRNPQSCSPNIGVLKSPPKDDNFQPNARDTPFVGLANRSQQPPPHQVVNTPMRQSVPNQLRGYQIPRLGHQQLNVRVPTVGQQMVMGHQKLPARQPQPQPARQWLFDPNFYGYPVNMAARPVTREDVQARKSEMKS